MRRLTATLIAGLLLISTQANAQIKEGGNQISVDLGLANPMANENINGDSVPFGTVGPEFGFGFLHQFRKNLSFGGDFNFKSLGHDDVTTGHGPAEVKSSAWTLLAIARGDLLPDNNIRPYGIVGLGLGGVKSESDYQTTRFSASNSSTGLAFALGGGVDYDINASWLAGAELRYNIIGTNHDDFGTSSVSTFDFLLKAGYKF